MEASRRWLVLVAMTGSLSMVMLDQTVVSVALPTMGHDLHLSTGLQQWVINAYVIALAVFVALGGRLGDQIGKTTTFTIGVALFFLASAACGLAPGAVVLLGSRALQGVGAALMTPASAAIVIDSFAERERGRAMAAYAGISQVFLAVGPLLGGFLTEFVSWRAVFWLNIPVGIASLILTRLARPENTRQQGTHTSALDVALLVVGLGLVVLAIQQGSQWGWGSPAVLGPLLVGAVASISFVVLQVRRHDPLLDLRLFAARPFLGDCLVVALFQFGLLPVVLYASLFLQDLLKLSPVATGVATLPLVVMITATAQIGGRWFDRSGVRPPVLLGLAVAALGILAWGASLLTLRYAWMIPGMVLMGAGLGLTLSPTNTDALNRVEQRRRGQASGLVQTVRQLGGTVGVAVVGAVILAQDHRAARGSIRLHVAVAVSAGFVVAALAILVALALATWLLARHHPAPISTIPA